MIRSVGGGSVVKAVRRAQDQMKRDERILGDGQFTQFVLDSVKRGEKIAMPSSLILSS